MPTRNIPRAEWVTFFDRFSRQHERWLITLEIVTSGLGALRELRDKPLIGISADLKGSGVASISIIAGDKPADHIDHLISGPSRVALEETDEGAHKGLRIESRGGEITLLRFRSSVLPETVDGRVAG
jgi:hypothetical protein